MPMTVNDLLKLFPQDSELQINIIHSDNRCTYYPCPHFIVGGDGYHELREKKISSLDVELYTEDDKTIALLVIGTKTNEEGA